MNCGTVYSEDSLIYSPMPELPEVEITARRLGAALAGAEVESTLAPGMVAVKTLDPMLSALEGMTIAGASRIGKMPIVQFSEPTRRSLDLLVHLMSARAGSRSSTSARRSRTAPPGC